ncbi:MAG TPA: SAM-dependent methyltransferase [Burkholderiales bacterium]|nr:SAM-dependent methyltransferase [Burkholderiales bacterium]
MSDLPRPSPAAAAHSERVVASIRAEIECAGGWIGFARYMELALYAPALGYYMAGARKLGADGDFVTAPELAPLYGHTLARQVAQGLAAVGGEVLEIGAGSGALAASLLEELGRLERLPEKYLILELSPELRERSRDTLAARVPHLLERVAWLNVLPPAFTGVVVGNEVLDAMPVSVVRTRAGAIEESGVAVARGNAPFEWAGRPAAGEVAGAARALALPDGYRTEIGLVARGFVSSVANMLERGVALFVDYGFPRAEYYHPQRREGTLMCHYRHRAHGDPFFLPGLQDITAHVDFTAMAEAAHGAGADVLGYATQAQFLINCGLTEVMQRASPEDAKAYLPLAAAANRLTSPAEMGELFKALAFGRGVDAELIGFRAGDRRHTL